MNPQYLNSIDTVEIFYRNGMSLAEIAGSFGVHPTTVWRWLKKAGIPLRPKGRPKKRPIV